MQSLRSGEKSGNSLTAVIKDNQKLISDQETAVALIKRIQSDLTTMIERFDKKQSPSKKGKARQSILDKFTKSQAPHLELSSLIEEVDLNMKVLSLKVTEFNEENNVLRDEFTRCNQSNLALNKKIIYY